MRNLLDNPVLIKEMRVGFREKKVFYALIAWVVVVAIVASIAVLSAFDPDQSIDQMPESGRVFMEVLFWVQMVLLWMLCPSLTTSAVSGERERKSFDMLLTTHLAPSELIFGKFIFAASFTVLALCCTVPLESVVFFLGGVSLSYFLTTKLVLATFGFLCSLFGLMMSARETRSAYATGQTYMSLIFICWVSLFGLIGMRYSDGVTWPWKLSVALLLAYIALFLFWKAVNHLEERARHQKILLSIGLGFYLVFLLMGLVASYFTQSSYHEAWAASAPVHYLLFCILLNPWRLSRRVERERFSQSFLSRPLFWVVILSIGLVVPLFFLSHDKVIAVSLAALGMGVATGLFCRGLALGRESKYPQICIGLVSVLVLVPSLAAGVSRVSSGDFTWHPSLISPVYLFGHVMDHNPSGLPLTAMGFYGLLLFIGLVCHHRHHNRGE